MTEQYGIPTWASYAIFAISTIAVGLLFGIVSRFYVQYNRERFMLEAHLSVKASHSL